MRRPTRTCRYRLQEPAKSYAPSRKEAGLFNGYWSLRYRWRNRGFAGACPSSSLPPVGPMRASLPETRPRGQHGRAVACPSDPLGSGNANIQGTPLSRDANVRGTSRRAGVEIYSCATARGASRRAALTHNVPHARLLLRMTSAEQLLQDTGSIRRPIDKAATRDLVAETRGSRSLDPLAHSARALAPCLFKLCLFKNYAFQYTICTEELGRPGPGERDIIQHL